MEIHSVISEQPPFPQHPSPPPFQPQPRQQQPMVFVYEAHVWEYKVTSRPTDTLMTEEELNALGKEAWELTATASHADQVQFFFKRLVNR